MRCLLFTANSKVAGLDSVRICDEFVHGSPSADLIFEGIDELSIILDTMAGGHMTIKTKEKHGSLSPPSTAGVSL